MSSWGSGASGAMSRWAGLRGRPKNAENVIIKVESWNRGIVEFVKFDRLLTGLTGFAAFVNKKYWLRSVEIS